MSDISAEYLRERVHYDPATGRFTWRVKVAQRIKPGDPAHSVHHKGYISFFMCGKQRLAHRMAWLYVTGRMPVDQIDHKNGDRGDNRFDNLREVTHAQNMQNTKRPVPNRTGFRGVYMNGKRFGAQIGHHGKLKHIGTFDTPEEAHQAYLDHRRSHRPFHHEE